VSVMKWSVSERGKRIYLDLYFYFVLKMYGPDTEEILRRIEKWKYGNVLNLDNLNLTRIPENLPANLKEFYCNNNQITKLENLPANLKELYCVNNQITKIENLPANLQKLFCMNNQITKIENLPASLNCFYCYKNQISKIENLPERLEEFVCGYNQITKIENLPATLTTFYCMGNPLDNEYLRFKNINTHNSHLFDELRNLGTFVEIPISGEVKLHPLSISTISYDKLENNDILADYENDIQFKRYYKYPQETRLLRQHPISRNRLKRPTLFKVVLDETAEIPDENERA
jgi:Leucine-rich repeat (LRR) protein